MKTSREKFYGIYIPIKNEEGGPYGNGNFVPSRDYKRNGGFDFYAELPR